MATCLTPGRSGSLFEALRQAPCGPYGPLRPLGSIGTGRAARATADGYTIALGTISTQMLNGALYSLQYDVVNDFVPISALVSFPTILFARETIRWARR